MEIHMVIRHPFKIGLMALILCLFALSACSPGKRTTQTQPDLQATIDILQTQVAHFTQTPSQANTQPTATPMHKPSPTFSEIRSAYAGFMVFVDQKFLGLDFNGQPLYFSVDALGVEGLNLYSASVFSRGVVHAFTPDMKIRMVTAQGIDVLDYISMEKPVNVTISADGSKIAWGYESFGGDAPGSELWTANIDGSNAKLVDEILPENNLDRWLVLRPFQWTQDGKLIYGTKLTGIGGYIIFDGWNSLSLYDPFDGSQVVLVEDEPQGMCINSLSADRSLAAIGCKEIRIRKLADGSEITLPALNLQNVAGSAFFSPTSKWIAYATAFVDPQNERSQVVVADTAGLVEPYPIHTLEGGDLHVLGWINEQSFLFTAHDMDDNITTIWRIDYDGSLPTELIEAQFLGFIPLD